MGGVGTLAVDDHVGNAVVRVVVERESELVMVVERQTHGIEAGAEVGGRGGHAHVNAIADWIHGCSLKRSSLIRRELGYSAFTVRPPHQRELRSCQSSTRRMDGSPVTKSERLHGLDGVAQGFLVGQVGHDAQLLNLAVVAGIGHGGLQVLVHTR